LLHYYFRSKDRLFETVIDSVSSKIIPNLTMIIESDLDTLPKIEAIVSRYIDFLLENPQMPLFLISEISRNPERMKTLMTTLPNFSKMQQFGAHLMAEMQSGKLKPFNPLHLTLNIISLCVFPFAARPMVQNVLKISDEDYQIILSQRKTEVIKFLREALQT
jgi:TetR/AcrR family transcriptional regulator